MYIEPSAAETWIAASVSRARTSVAFFIGGSLLSVLLRLGRLTALLGPNFFELVTPRVWVPKRELSAERSPFSLLASNLLAEIFLARSADPKPTHRNRG